MSLSKTIIDLAIKKGVALATAESCTGGLIAAALTDVAGSSATFDRGFVTYSNEAKAEMLGVLPMAIEKHGAVSKEVASQMARGALAHSRANIAVSVTGIAGPGGGSKDKPVGLVFIGVATQERIDVQKHIFRTASNSVPERAEIRNMTVISALEALQRALDQAP